MRTGTNEAPSAGFNGKVSVRSLTVRFFIFLKFLLYAFHKGRIPDQVKGCACDCLCAVDDAVMSVFRFSCVDIFL